MTTPTHITFAEFLYLLVLTTTGVALNAVNAAIIALASVLPDIDTGASFTGKALPFFSHRIERKFGHRTLTHSAVAVVSISMVLLPLFFIDSGLYLCFLAGYASHPFLDTMTVHGVKLFYPFSTVKCVFPLEVNNPHRYRLQTGSKMDKALGLFFLTGCIPAYLIAHQGYERFIRATQKNIESAVRDYNEFSKDHFVFADVVAYDMMTKEKLKGSLEIVGTLDDHTLLFRANDRRIYPLGREYDADYVAEEVICRKGDPAHISVRSVDMSNQLLAQVRLYLNEGSEYHLFGALSSSDPIFIPQESRTFTPISGSFSSIKFNYATYDDIQRLNLENLFVTKGTLTIRTVLLRDTLAVSSGVKSLQVPSASQPARDGEISAIGSFFAQVAFQIDQKEAIEILHQKGDTVQEGSILVKRDLATFYDQQIELTQQKIASLEQEQEYQLADLDQRLSRARATVQEDSLGYVEAEKQHASGYLSKLSLDELEKKRLESRAAYNHLLSTTSRIENKFLLQVRKLRNDLNELRSKERAAERQSELRSTTAGVVYDVRQLYHNNKLQITFVIKRLSTTSN